MSQLRNFVSLLLQSLPGIGMVFDSIQNSEQLLFLQGSKSTNGAFSCAGELICLLQSLAFLEVTHGALVEFLSVDLGIVPSGVLLPLMQWGGRTHFLLAIVRRIPEFRLFGLKSRPYPMECGLCTKHFHS